MKNGISVFAGLNCTLEENILLIEKSAKLGLNRLFTSAQIPETSDDAFEDFATILNCALENNFEIILDVNPATVSEFNFDGVTLRLDDGFTVEKTAELSCVRKICLNASTVTLNFLNALKNSNADFKNISALHNYYPRIETGLDTYYFENQNKILQDFEIEVGAFVPSFEGKRRPPLCEGLPTLEDCRNFSTDLSARFLAAIGTDFVIIGDSLPTDLEIFSISEIMENEVILNAKLFTENPTAGELLNYKFTRRPEISKSVIRAVESRQILKSIGGHITPENSAVERVFGDITIDNTNFGRYEGELQIVDDILPADSRVNVVGSVLEAENFLTRYIKPNQKFSFRFI